MKFARATAICLLVLDIITAVVVFNAISYLHFRGLGLASHLIIPDLALPIGTMVFSIFLIEGYETRTDMLSPDYTSQHTIALIGSMLATLLLTFVFIPAGFELQSSRGVIALSFVTLI